MPMREQHISMMLYANQGIISSSPPTSLNFGSERKFLCILLISLRQTTIEWEILSHPDYTVRSCCLSVFTPPNSFTSKLFPPSLHSSPKLWRQQQQIRAFENNSAHPLTSLSLLCKFSLNPGNNSLFEFTSSRASFAAGMHAIPPCLRGDEE